MRLTICGAVQVEERDVARNYGFIVTTLDERQYVLSAVTHGIRNNWIQALRTASNLPTHTELVESKVTYLNPGGDIMISETEFKPRIYVSMFCRLRASGKVGRAGIRSSPVAAPRTTSAVCAARPAAPPCPAPRLSPALQHPASRRRRAKGRA